MEGRVCKLWDMGHTYLGFGSLVSAIRAVRRQGSGQYVVRQENARKRASYARETEGLERDGVEGVIAESQYA
jgi:hypothetical protein